MFLSLLLTGAIAAFLGIAQMWWGVLESVVFAKALVTLLIAGSLISFLIAVDYDLPGSRGRVILGAVVVLAVAAGGLTIAQMWWSPLALALFGKIMATFLILGVLAAFFIAVSEDFGANKKLKDGKYID